MPDIIKSFQEAMPIYRKAPTLQQLKTSSILKTIVACRVCRGERVVAVKSDTLQTFTYTRCFYCSGTGVMEN